MKDTVINNKNRSTFLVIKSSAVINGGATSQADEPTLRLSDHLGRESGFDLVVFILGHRSMMNEDKAKAHQPWVGGLRKPS